MKPALLSSFSFLMQDGARPHQRKKALLRCKQLDVVFRIGPLAIKAVSGMSMIVLQAITHTVPRQMWRQQFDPSNQQCSDDMRVRSCCSPPVTFFFFFTFSRFFSRAQPIVSLPSSMFFVSLSTLSLFSSSDFLNHLSSNFCLTHSLTYITMMYPYNFHKALHQTQ